MYKQLSLIIQQLPFACLLLFLVLPACREMMALLVRYRRQHKYVELTLKPKTKFYTWKYLVKKILKCFSSMLFNVLLCRSQHVLWLPQRILFAWNIPDVNVLSRIDKERSNIVLINIGCTTEVGNDQPACKDQFCI